MLRKSSRNSHISSIFTTEHTSVGPHCFTQVLARYYKTRDEVWSHFLPTKQWFGSALLKDMETCFKVILLIITQYGWGYLWQFATKIL